METDRRIRGRPRKRWVEDIEEDMQELGIRGWRKLSKERTEWRRITEKAKTHSGLDFSNYQLNAQFFYFSTIYMLHYAPQHVSSSTLLILRRANCITTASGIVTLCKQQYSMQRIAPQGSQRTPATCIAATTPELTVGILNTVF